MQKKATNPGIRQRVLDALTDKPQTIDEVFTELARRGVERKGIHPDDVKREIGWLVANGDAVPQIEVGVGRPMGYTAAPHVLAARKVESEQQRVSVLLRNLLHLSVPCMLSGDDLALLGKWAGTGLCHAAGNSAARRTRIAAWLVLSKLCAGVRGGLPLSLGFDSADPADRRHMGLTMGTVPAWVRDGQEVVGISDATKGKRGVLRDHGYCFVVDGAGWQIGKGVLAGIEKAWAPAPAAEAPTVEVVGRVGGREVTADEIARGTVRAGMLAERILRAAAIPLWTAYVDGSSVGVLLRWTSKWELLWFAGYPGEAAKWGPDTAQILLRARALLEGAGFVVEAPVPAKPPSNDESSSGADWKIGDRVTRTDGFRDYWSGEITEVRERDVTIRVDGHGTVARKITFDELGRLFRRDPHEARTEPGTTSTKQPLPRPGCRVLVPHLGEQGMLVDRSAMWGSPQWVVIADADGARLWQGTPQEAARDLKRIEEPKQSDGDDCQAGSRGLTLAEAVKQYTRTTLPPDAGAVLYELRVSGPGGLLWDGELVPRLDKAGYKISHRLYATREALHGAGYRVNLTWEADPVCDARLRLVNQAATPTS